MLIRRLFWQILIIIGLTGCAIWRTPHIARIALLAPFEGRYREIGYSAIYPARMALADMGLTHLELLAVDDGGTIQTAQARARALLLDDSIKAVMILGYDSADSSVLQTLSDMPIIIIGEWATVPIHEGVFILSHADIPTMVSYTGRLDITATVESPFLGGDAFGLLAYADLYNRTRPTPHVQVVTSGKLADEVFTARLLASDIYVPRPNHLSTMVYDATRLLATVIADGDVSRQVVVDALSRVDFMGEQVGRISFGDDGYWADAPLYTYVYVDTDADGDDDLSPVTDTP